MRGEGRDVTGPVESDQVKNVDWFGSDVRVKGERKVTWRLKLSGDVDSLEGVEENCKQSVHAYATYDRIGEYGCIELAVLSESRVECAQVPCREGVGECPRRHGCRSRDT